MGYDEIKKIIESCHINFLIGSGASSPYLGTLSNIEDLLTQLSLLPESDEKMVIDASIKRYYFELAIKGNLEIPTGDESTLNQVRNAYKDFISSINTILNRRKTNLVSKQVNLFTTNMDLFLDFILEDQKLAFNDGFEGKLVPKYGTENFHNSIYKTSSHYEFQSEVPLFNLFKLHGSVNWKLLNDSISYDYSQSILKEISQVKVDNTNFLEIRKKNSDGTWTNFSLQDLRNNYKKQGLERKPDHNCFIKSYNKLQMVNPTKKKFEITTRDVIYYELLRMYSNHLERENSVLFVFGFSFADEHIREITKRVAEANPTLLIVIFAYDFESKRQIEKEISSRSNIKFIYDEEDNTLYSMENITLNFFKKLADELEG